MKPQFDHNLVSSFYLWMDNKLCQQAEAVITGRVQTFRYANGINTPSNLNAFYSSERQFCADSNLAPNYVWLSGNQLPQQTAGTKIIIDHDKGRILMDKSYGTGITLSGNFVQKEINLYITNETEEEILLRNDFYIQSGQSYSETMNQLAKARYSLPCVFVTNNYSRNDPFAIGGMKDTNTFIKAIIFASSNYQLDGVMALFRDSSEECLKIIDQSKFPYGEYWHVKDYPYSYTGLVSSGFIDTAFIKSVESYKLKESSQSSVQKIRKDLYLGYLDFNISTIRVT